MREMQLDSQEVDRTTARVGELCNSWNNSQSEDWLRLSSLGENHQSLSSDTMKKARDFEEAFSLNFRRKQATYPLNRENLTTLEFIIFGNSRIESSHLQ